MTDEQLAVQIKCGEMDKLETLWGHMQGFIRSQAAKCLGSQECRNGCTIEDLIQSAFPAFLDAIEYYDPDNEKGGSFLKAFSFFLSKSFTAALCLTSTHKCSTLDQAISLDASVKGNGLTGETDLTIGSTIEDKNSTLALEKVDRAIIYQTAGTILHNMIDSLSVQQQDVIYARYWDRMTCAEIGKRFGFSRQRVSQIEQAALDKLRSHPDSKKLTACGIFDE